METFTEYCVDYIERELFGHKGRIVEACDLAFDLTQGPNANGSLTYSRSNAIEYLKEWWYDAADYFDYEKSNFGEAQNPFDNPEAYMVCMVIEGVRSLIDQTTPIQKAWNERVELTGETINQILNEVKSLKIDWLT